MHLRHPRERTALPQTPRSRGAVRGDRNGHVDNSIVVWIVLILLVIAIPKLVENATGQSLSSYWQALPDDRTSLLIRTLIYLAIVVAVAGVATIAGGDGVKARGKGDQVVIRLPQPGARVFGVGLCAVAVYLTGSGLLGQGLFWWVVLGVGLVFGGIGFAVLGSNDQVIVEVDRVRRESRFIRSVTSSEECAVDSSASPQVTMVTRTSGGAFGQPLNTHHGVCVGASEVYATSSEGRAEALTTAISDALTQLQGDDSME